MVSSVFPFFFFFLSAEDTLFPDSSQSFSPRRKQRIAILITGQARTKAPEA